MSFKLKLPDEPAWTASPSQAPHWPSSYTRASTYTLLLGPSTLDISLLPTCQQTRRTPGVPRPLLSPHGAPNPHKRSKHKDLHPRAASPAPASSQSHWNHPGCLGPHTPFSGSFSSSPAHRMQCLMPLPSRERERGKKCHLVNDKLFQSHSSDTKCPGQRTAPASSLWLGGSQLSTSGGAIPHHRPPAHPPHLTRQPRPIPGGGLLRPLPTTPANYPLGLQLRHYTLSPAPKHRKTPGVATSQEHQAQE